MQVSAVAVKRMPLKELSLGMAVDFRGMKGGLLGLGIVTEISRDSVSLQEIVHRARRRRREVWMSLGSVWFTMDTYPVVLARSGKPWTPEVVRID